MATLYEHIEENKRRTVLLVLAFPVVFAVFTWVVFAVFFWITGHMTDPNASQTVYQTATSTDWTSQLRSTLLILVPLCWLVAMVWMGISFFFGDKWLMSGAGATKVTEQEQPEIYHLVENLCISRGLPVPRIFIMDDNSLNAFATGRDPKHASVALTKGIIQRLERVELEGVIAHELSHVENRDIRLMLITVAGISFFTFVGEIILRSSLRSRSGNRNGGTNLVLLVLGLIFLVYGYVMAPLLRLAVSRTREYQADATAALMTRHPKALASALRKISSDSHVEALDAHPSMAAMCIANPLSKMQAFSWVSGLLATHPPIEKRIEALMEMDRGY